MDSSHDRTSFVGSSSQGIVLDSQTVSSDVAEI